jgi:hypothetical protein
VPRIRHRQVLTLQRLRAIVPRVTELPERYVHLPFAASHSSKDEDRRSVPANSGFVGQGLNGRARTVDAWQRGVMTLEFSSTAEFHPVAR